MVQLLGREIGFKVLENRLQQMWVRSGVINIVYSGKDFFLVLFSSQEDHEKALVEGSYDHYHSEKMSSQLPHDLISRDSPNLHETHIIYYDSFKSQSVRENAFKHECDNMC